MSDKTIKKYQSAIEKNFSALKVESIKYLSEGWDSVACLVNQNLIFRFPKREEVERSLKIEITLLPELAPRLPRPIPNFKYIGKPSRNNFDYTFVGYEMLEGWLEEDWPEEIEEAEWWRPQLGEFVTVLHQFPVEAARELGVRNMALTGIEETPANWHEMFEEFYGLVRTRIFPLLEDDPQDAVADYFEAFLDDEACFKFEPVLLHGDLDSTHILLDLEKRQINGIIDFGDVAIGDPAFDISEKVLPYYGGKMDETYLKRRHFYDHLGGYISVIFGQGHNDPALIEYGVNEILSFVVK